MLLMLVVVTAALGWALAQVVTAFTGRALPVPWLASVTLLSLAVALLIWTLLCRPRLPRRTRLGERIRPTNPLPPLVAARTAALAMAASRVGSIVGGLYLGILIGETPNASTAAGRSALLAGLAAAGAVAMAVVGVWLEAMCRLPQDPRDDAQDTRLRP
jgi:Kef-type K+ transport system membrane component KefB